MIVLKDKTKVLKFQKKHNIIDENHNVINANKVNEVNQIIKKHFPEIYKKAKKYAKEDSGGDSKAEPSLYTHIYDLVDNDQDKKFFEILEKNLQD